MQNIIFKYLLFYFEHEVHFKTFHCNSSDEFFFVYIPEYLYTFQFILINDQIQKKSAH